jgi:dTDP-4-dehydrorhamnose 3,5-epimerase
MDVTPTPLAGVLLLRPKRFLDARGFFSETYNRRDLAEAGIEVDFVQDNLSMSRQQGTLRGLHFQREPQAQAKLVGVSQGAVRDVVVDLRLSSPTFAQHFSVVLTGDEGNQIFVPSGFAHGFLTLEPNTLLSYKVSQHYATEYDSGIRFDDPFLAIDWGCDPSSLVLSEKDQTLPAFDPAAPYFA